MSESSVNEAQLLQALRAGSEQAFTEIYDRYWKSLYLYARHRLSSEDDALDITQDIFVKLWTCRESLLISTSLSGYLFKSLKNKMLDHIDKTFVREDYVKFLKNDSFLASESTAEKVAEGEICSLVEKSVETMPVRMKEVFELSRNQGRSVAEISEQLDLSPQTVKNQISHALTRLRLSLNDYLVAISFFYFLFS